MEVMMPPNDGQGNRPGQRRGARGGCLPQWPWAELFLPHWGSGFGLVTSFSARLRKVDFRPVVQRCDRGRGVRWQKWG